MCKESFLFMLLFILLFLGLPLGLAYYGNCRKARIYNQANGTNYTCGDFFWAREQINAKNQTIKLTK